MLTQPARPAFRFLRRLGGRPSGTPVVFVHGYGQNCATFWGMAADLARRDVGPLYGFNYRCLADIRAIADRLDGFLRPIVEETGAESVDLVCHSMGGLVALEHLRRSDEHRVRRCVTIATPHAGVRWPGPIFGACGAQMREGSDYLRELAGSPCSVPLLSVYSRRDVLFFTPRSASVAARGGYDLPMDDGGHLSLLFHPAVLSHVADFLKPMPARAPQLRPLELYLDAAE